jgi:uncharacterized protein (TIGR02246 family)
MKALIASAAITVLSIGTAIASTDEVEIRSLISKYESALNRSDVDAVMPLYGKEPTFMPQHAPAQTGRPAVKQAYENVFKTIKLNVTFTIHHVDVIGDTAWARTSSDGLTTILANSAIVKEGNNELFIFKKENGAWKIYQYLFSTNQPRQ